MKINFQTSSITNLSNAKASSWTLLELEILQDVFLEYTCSTTTVHRFNKNL